MEMSFHFANLKHMIRYIYIGLALIRICDEAKKNVDCKILRKKSNPDFLFNVCSKYIMNMKICICVSTINSNRASSGKKASERKLSTTEYGANDCFSLQTASSLSYRSFILQLTQISFMYDHSFPGV